MERRRSVVKAQQSPATFRVRLIGRSAPTNGLFGLMSQPFSTVTFFISERLHNTMSLCSVGLSVVWAWSGLGLRFGGLDYYTAGRVESLVMTALLSSKCLKQPLCAQQTAVQLSRDCWCQAGSTVAS